MKQLQFFGLILILALGCKKNNAESDQSNFSGSYKGKLYSGSLKSYQTSNTEVHFNGSNYDSSNNIYHPGSNLYTFGTSTGTYEVKPSNKIMFTNTPSFYTAEFDWGTILSGDYTYLAKGDSLILNKIVRERLPEEEPVIYQYRLKQAAD